MTSDYNTSFKKECKQQVLTDRNSQYTSLSIIGRLIRLMYAFAFDILNISPPLVGRETSASERTNARPWWDEVPPPLRGGAGVTRSASRRDTMRRRNARGAPRLVRSIGEAGTRGAPFCAYVGDTGKALRYYSSILGLAWLLDGYSSGDGRERKRDCQPGAFSSIACQGLRSSDEMNRQRRSRGGGRVGFRSYCLLTLSVQVEESPTASAGRCRLVFFQRKANAEACG
ncbi:unnamed protein product [Amoebophrya sp. A25]|nr:unnamed protein product [Amoebophrya sp. A25]|eukprot:GSA25T00000220001.1